MRRAWLSRIEGDSGIGIGIGMVLYGCSVSVMVLWLFLGFKQIWHDFDNVCIFTFSVHHEVGA